MERGAQEGGGGGCGVREVEGPVVSSECDPGDEVAGLQGSGSDGVGVCGGDVGVRGGGFTGVGSV